MAKATSEQECIDRHVEYPYDVWTDSMDDLQRLRLKSVFDLVASGEWVLDIGCNSGYAVEFLPPPCRVWGVDVSPTLVAKAAKRLVNARLSSAENLPYKSNFFDVAVLGEILEHVHDPKKVLLEAARVSRRAVIGSTPHESGTWGAHRVESHPFHVRCYTRESLAADLRVVSKNITITTIPTGNNPQMYVFEAIIR